MDAMRRSSIAFAVLVIVWIVVYWWWEPKPRSIAFDQGSKLVSLPPESRTEPAPPREPVRTPPPEPAPKAEEPQPRSTPPTVGGVEAPAFRAYTLRRGDTFEIIARRELGSSSHAAAISRANPLLDPTRLREGQTIRIPLDPSNIQGREVSGVPADQVVPGMSEYLVKSGDTLGEISRAVYGSPVHWGVILDANRSILKNEKSIRAGQRLVIPPLTPGDSTPGPR
jgi:nucleoid-associated protein YgaU